MTHKTLYLFFLLSFFLQNETQACSCLGASLVENEVKRSDLVAIGKVISIKTVSYQAQMIKDVPDFIYTRKISKVKIRISTIYKGETKQKDIFIYTGVGNGDCGFPFEKGEEYILYTNKYASPFFRTQITAPKPLKNTIWTNICTRTQELNEKEVAELDKIRENSE